MSTVQSGSHMPSPEIFMMTFGDFAITSIAARQRRK